MRVKDILGNIEVLVTLPQDLTTTASPTFAGMTINDLTASKLLSTDADKGLVSVANLASWIAGTTNQINVTNDGDGSVTLSMPQNIHVGASPTFAGTTLSGLTASRIMFTDGSKGLVSGATDITAAELEELTDSSETVLHTHAAATFDYSDISGNDANTDVTGVELEELSDGSTTTLHSHTVSGTFVDRGDPSDYDFSLLSGLTANSTYNDVDCSSIVPSGAKAILFYAEITDDVTNTVMKLRKNGNSNVYNNTIIRPQAANVTNSIDAIVACDSGRIIEAFISTGVTSAGLIVRGWWI